MEIRRASRLSKITLFRIVLLPCSCTKKVLWRRSITITLKYVLQFFQVYCANKVWRTEDVAAKTQQNGRDALLIPEIEREGICMTPKHRLETLTWRLKGDKRKQKLAGKKISSRQRCNTRVLWRSANMHRARNLYGWGVRAEGFPTAYHFDIEILHLPDITGLFISPSGISELDWATTKTDTAERSISIGRESLQVFLVLGALAYFQVPPLGVVVKKNGAHNE